MPSWLNEGMGDYFFMSTREEDGSYSVGDMNHGRLRVVQKALEDGTTVSFSEMLGFEQKDYYRNRGVFYPQGWSMVHFLMQNDDEKRRELIPKLIKDFKRSKNFRKSTDRLFKGLDQDDLDRQWIGWLLTTEARDPLKTLATEFGDRIASEDLSVENLRWTEVYEWHLEHLREEDPERYGAPRDESDRDWGRGGGDR